MQVIGRFYIVNYSMAEGTVVRNRQRYTQQGHQTATEITPRTLPDTRFPRFLAQTTVWRCRATVLTRGVRRGW